MPSKIDGKGFFAVEKIDKGELLAVKSGHLIDRATLEANRDVIQNAEMQVADELWLAPLAVDELEQSMIYINHSCEPNMAVQGQIGHIALHDIEAGEEITADYGISFNNADFSMECHCGLATCRKVITGLDWRKPELQRKYGDNFPWYLLRKIKAQ